MSSPWIVSVNAVLGGLVVAVGAWLASQAFSVLHVGLVLVAATGFLWWRGRTVTLIWAWSTLLLGIECFAWPIATMLQVRSAGGEPSDEQMGAILSATLMGVFSAVFWTAFSYGLFKRARKTAEPATASRTPRQR
jgi:hypothetical protein